MEGMARAPCGFRSDHQWPGGGHQLGGALGSSFQKSSSSELPVFSPYRGRGWGGTWKHMMSSPASWLKDPWSTAAAWFHSRPSGNCGQILSVSNYPVKANHWVSTPTHPLYILQTASCWCHLTTLIPNWWWILSVLPPEYIKSPTLPRLLPLVFYSKHYLPMGPALTTLFKSLLHLDSSDNVFFSFLSAAPPIDPIGVMSPIQRQPISLLLDSGISLWLYVL